MPHVPSMPDQISRRVLARFTSVTGATTANLNGDIATLIGLFAEELSLIDRTFSTDFVRAHWFEGSPELVLARLQDMPLRFPRPRGPVAAFGGAVTLTRTITSGAVTYDVGTIGCYNPAKPDVLYLNAEPVTFGNGVGTVTDIMFKCLVPGEVGTAEVQELRAVSYSPDGNISQCVNTSALIGRDAETVDQASRRAMLWLRSLAQSQREALESVARNFVDEDGDTIVNAHAAVDPDVRGITYLTVDNGAGMEGYVKPAVPSYGVFSAIGAGLRHRLMFSDYPAATPPQLYIGGSSTPVSPLTMGWTSLDEAGELWLKRDPGSYGINTTPGTSWEIRKYMVYTGIMARLQKYINRFCAPSGGRVIVRRPVTQNITISGIIVTSSSSGAGRQQVLANCKTATLAYIRSLNMGQPLLQHELHVQLSRLPGVLNYIPDQGDIYPGGAYYKLIANPNFISYR